MEGLKTMAKREGYYDSVLRTYKEDRQKYEERKKEIDDKNFQIRNLKSRVTALEDAISKLAEKSEIWIDSDEDISMFED